MPQIPCCLQVRHCNQSDHANAPVLFAVCSGSTVQATPHIHSQSRSSSVTTLPQVGLSVAFVGGQQVTKRHGISTGVASSVRSSRKPTQIIRTVHEGKHRRHQTKAPQSQERSKQTPVSERAKHRLDKAAGESNRPPQSHARERRR